MSSLVANKILGNPQNVKDAMQLAKEKLDFIDFKMVTFSLSGKDYGIDIMKIKEIARFVNFTYVPNTPNFVRGVYNLRGEIISIIDLRAMFNLPFVQRSNNEEEPGLIIRLDNNLIGVIVDKIDKVIGINSENIQPPHPIFGDINIKFIAGVVENEGRLYIILDVEKILSKPEEKTEEPKSTNFNTTDKAGLSESEAYVAPNKDFANSDKDQQKIFIKEALNALLGFLPNAVNNDWFEQRYSQWEKDKNLNQMLVRSIDDARQFMETFYSPATGALWHDEYFQDFKNALPETAGSSINVWNPGCGRGYETYSIAIALKQKYPDARIKIWASDKDLLCISAAPNLVFSERDIPELYQEYMVEGRNGKSFNSKIKENVLFEYHDMLNEHSLPPLDMVISRDVVSFLGNESQDILFNFLNEIVKPGGIVILGKNEVLPLEDWKIKDFDQIRIAQRG